jgi:hypothetical protein
MFHEPNMRPAAVNDGSTQMIPPDQLPTAVIEQAKPAPRVRRAFTNCGKPDRRENAAKRAFPKITRVPFTVSRLMEFCIKRELVNQTGHDVWDWPLVVVKELTDNALDEAEEAGIAPVVEVEVTDNKIAISDNCRGIPAAIIERVLDATAQGATEAATSREKGHPPDTASRLPARAQGFQQL